jgi:hypothetical protein
MDADLEVFKPATPLGLVGGKTVYPPRRDTNGKYALSEVLDWADLMNDVYRTFQRTCSLLRVEMPDVSVEGAQGVRRCLDEI